MPQITAIKETKKGRLALFLDGEFAFSLDEETFAAADLHVEDELDAWQLEELRRKSDTRKAIDRALDILALRDHAAGELYQKICRKFDPHSAAAAVAQTSPRRRESTRASSPGAGGVSAYSGRSAGKRVSSICSAAYL